MAISLSAEVRMIKGVGPQRAELLAQRGIYTLEDLLSYLPFRYEDRIHFSKVKDIQPNGTYTIRARVMSGQVVRSMRGRDAIYHLLLQDDVGGLLPCKFFHGGAPAGRVRPPPPLTLLPHTTVHPLTPPPPPLSHLGPALDRRATRQEIAIACRVREDGAREALKRILPFKPTAAQKRVLAEIAADLEKPSPMNRLLQGDVGSGKTIIALQAAVIAIENGAQAALMAPTEILAVQHFLSARRILAKPAYRVDLLISALHPPHKPPPPAPIRSPHPPLLIRTHP